LTGELGQSEGGMAVMDRAVDQSVAEWVGPAVTDRETGQSEREWGGAHSDGQWAGPFRERVGAGSL